MKITVIGLCGRSVFMDVEHFHAPGETVHAAGLYSEPGGKGYNQAVAAARLGAEVSFITCVGDDGDGRDCLRLLEREGVSHCALVLPNESTAYACILTDSGGENRVTVFQGAASKLTAEFIQAHEELIASSDMLLLNNEYPQECNLAALEIAEKHGVPVLLDPAPAREADREFLSRLYVITPNLSEAELLASGASGGLDMLPQKLRELGVSRAVVTLGEKGALLAENGKPLLFPAIKCPVKDTTGAGDCFSAALAVALAGGESLAAAVQKAINASALSVSKKYVMPSLPTKEELERNFVPVKAAEME